MAATSPEYGMEMPEDLVHRATADAGLLLWAYNQRLIFIDERIEQVEQELRHLRNRRAAQVREIANRMEAYYDVRRDDVPD